MNGNGGTKLLFWVLGLAIAILFAAVGLLVQDVRGDIEENHRAINALERQVIKLERDLHEEQRVTQQIRDWYTPLIADLAKLVQALQRSQSAEQPERER